MAGRKGADGIDIVLSLIPPGSHRMVHRLLQRAMDEQARRAGQAAKAATRGVLEVFGRRVVTSTGFARELGKALRHRADLGSKVSVKQKSPTSGGRAFHFAHSMVGKDGVGPGPSSGGAARSGGVGTKGTSAPSGRGVAKVGRAAAHMKYIERSTAVERGKENAQAPDRDAPKVTGMSREEVGQEIGASSAQAGQGYIEREAKLESGERVVFSFGTIGDTFADRRRFWQALEEAEAHPSARIQHRLIVELPHEASPEARYEIVKEFCRKFEDDDVPYWVALHAPGPKNDDRNFHAHIVYSERPARRMEDPSSGLSVWDFEVLRHWRDSSRHERVSRPHRQNKLREYTGLHFIRSRRHALAKIANEILRRDEVKDDRGEPVLYDARSYKDMGLDVVPMRSINRIVADRVKDGTATVLDGDYTPQLIAAEIADAVAKRDRATLKDVELGNALRAASEASNPIGHNRTLPRDMKIAPWATPSRADMRVAARKITDARLSVLQVDLMARATLASVERIVAATSPEAVSAAHASKDPATRAEVPDAEMARLLHAAALEELDEIRRSVGQGQGRNLR